MKSKKYGMMLAVLAAAGGVSASAAPVPVYELKGLTVTATRQAETTKDVPANVQIVTEKEIKDRNVQNAAQAVALATGVQVDTTVEGSVNLRGYNSKNILVLVDGQQMNTAWNSTVDWNLIPTTSSRLSCLPVMRWMIIPICTCLLGNRLRRPFSTSSTGMRNRPMAAVMSRTRL